MSWVALVYHEVLGSTDGALPHFAVSRESFAAQLDWLAARGFGVDTLEAAAQANDARVVALTFDDGHWSHYARAFPLLAERGMRATFFVVSDWVGQRQYASWEQLREMKAAGMSIQSHSASHAYLSTILDAALRAELVRSKAVIDEELGQDTKTFALPGGDEPRGRWRFFREAGYKMVATSRPGANGQVNVTEGVTLLRRLTVRHGQPRHLFAQLAAQDLRVLLSARARHGVLDAVRRVIGRDRYARWRRQLLARLPGATRMLGS